MLEAGWGVGRMTLERSSAGDRVPGSEGAAVHTPQLTLTVNVNNRGEVYRRGGGAA